jgi:hypothetical protein
MAPSGIYERKKGVKVGPVVGTRQKVSARNNSSAWIEKRPKYEMSMTPYAVTNEVRRGARNSDECLDRMEM